MLLLIYSHFFLQQVCLNLFFLSRTSCLRCELLVLWEIFSPVSHSRWNHVFCDLHLIFLPLAFNPASLHASTQFRSSIDAIMFVAYIREFPPPPQSWDFGATAQPHATTYLSSPVNTMRKSHIIIERVRILLLTVFVKLFRTHCFSFMCFSFS